MNFIAHIIRPFPLSILQALKDQLSRVSNADEAEKLILDHSKNLNAVTDKLETQKHQQLHKLQDQLINRFVFRIAL